MTGFDRIDRILSILTYLTGFVCPVTDRPKCCLLRENIKVYPYHSVLSSYLSNHLSWDGSRTFLLLIRAALILLCAQTFWTRGFAREYQILRCFQVGIHSNVQKHCAVIHEHLGAVARSSELTNPLAVMTF